MSTITSMPAGTSNPPGSSRSADQPAPESVKDTLISVIIAFTLAFVFRGFVIEAFVIPTGSMAPTLMGSHMKFRGPESGYEWSVNPWQSTPGDSGQYPSPQSNIAVNDPISGERLSYSKVPLFAGDRILVLKYLYALQEPQRFDVVVFKNPTDPSQNYIKRLLGLPNEDLALVDGDVFVRPIAQRPAPASVIEGASLWSQPGWTIARKPALQQRATWQVVYDADYATPGAGADQTPFAAPAGMREGWNFGGPGGGRSYRFDRATRTELMFDQTKQRFSPQTPGPWRETWSLDDRYPYDQMGTSEGMPAQPRRFPVSDVRLRAGIEPTGDKGGGAGESPLSVSVVLTARSHEFVCTIAAGKATLSMRAQGKPSEPAVVLASGEVAPFTKGKVTNVDFWHSDQSLQLWVDGRLVAKGTYDWSPADRIRFATGKTIEELMRVQQGNPENVLSNGKLYQRADIRWVFEGGPFVLHRPAIERDLHYQPTTIAGGLPALATSPLSPLELAPDQFFCCGDNSPASLDGRLWDRVDPWVYQALPTPAGIVPRELMLGRAFFVYWPSIRYTAKPVPVPDFGRMRFIW